MNSAWHTATSPDNTRYFARRERSLYEVVSADGSQKMMLERAELAAMQLKGWEIADMADVVWALNAATERRAAQRANLMRDAERTVDTSVSQEPAIVATPEAVRPSNGGRAEALRLLNELRNAELRQMLLDIDDIPDYQDAPAWRGPVNKASVLAHGADPARVGSRCD